MNKKLLIAILIIFVCTLSFARAFLGLIGIIPWHYGYSDIFNSDRIDESLAKKIPYLERPVEYQPVIGFFIYIMWLLGKNLLGYAIYTWIFLTAITIITTLQLYELTGALNAKKKRLLWFFIFAPSLVFFGVYNWDIIVVMFTVLAINSFYKKQYTLASLFLGLGFNTKLFPILILPVMLLKTDYKQWFKILAVFVLAFLVINSFFIINNFDVWKFTFTFHSSRQPNIDSYWHLLNLGTPAVNFLSFILIGLSYLLVIYFHKKYDFISLSFMAVLIFLIFNKIFSPQYMLWLLPFLVLIQPVKLLSFYLLEFANLGVFFTGLYRILDSWQYLLPISTALAIARTIILVYFLVAAIIRFRLEPAPVENFE